MKKLTEIIKNSILSAGLGLGLLVGTAGCEKEVTKVVIEDHWYLFRDAYGNAEFESRYDTNPRTDDYYDDGILVTLYFGEENSGFERGDVYGYYLTQDTDPVNYWFKFLPDGVYYMKAGLEVTNERDNTKIDVYEAESPDFFQEKDVDSEVNMNLQYVGSYVPAPSNPSLAKKILPGKLYMPRNVYEKQIKEMSEAPNSNLEGFLKNAVPVDYSVDFINTGKLNDDSKKR